MLAPTPVKDPNEFSVRLGAFLYDGDVANLASLLSVQLNEVEQLEIDPKMNLEGMIYVKKKPPEAKRPPWAKSLDFLHGKPVEGLETSSSSAVLALRIDGKIVIFSFGYGRYLLNEDNLVPDFGIKTALNTLNHDSLRTVDLFSLEQEPIQRKSQAIKGSNINMFGVDVSRDVLKAVTGDPIKDIPWASISGGGGQYSFTVKIKKYEELTEVGRKLIAKYDVTDYQARFSWVDNIQRIRNGKLIDDLNALLLTEFNAENVDSVKLSLPGASDWSNIFGFTYTNAKTHYKPSPEIVDYYAANPGAGLTLDKLRTHRLFCTTMNGDDSSYSIYESIYFECIYDGKLHILFSKEWFTIDQDYVTRVELSLNEVPLSALKFPNVKTVPVALASKPAKTLSGSAIKVGKGAKAVKSTSLETEGDYNARIALALKMHLLDKKLVRSNGSASPIEVCDLLSDKGHFIHVKHRKGYSAGLSHLFAQGRVAGELLLSDQNFRVNARLHLKGAAKKLIPTAKLVPSECEIVFLVLGGDPTTVRQDLPFFSKVNLLATYRSLSDRQFKVSIGGTAIDP
ncbi:hypothetical protein CR105_11765 [Massilia eurypsychrophila]|uniref:Sporadically distributed protein, TIGR04141 family n=1 Tax=Massilia eurypsychrophila TaxID=1485217 RepID=A0A2G8TEW0_9BURK|nr:DUF6119 family protein [Massilia eurypsychrophila]PIL44596.1 hypothetical protein CR105_11765 [Massilia eurypsychrophila]